MPFKRHSNSGFTLVEIMIALGITSVLTLAISTMLSNGQKGAKKISQDIEQANISNMIINVMRDKNSCEYILNGASLTTAATTTIASGTGAAITTISKVVTLSPLAKTDLYLKSNNTGLAAEHMYGTGTNGQIYIADMRLNNYVAGTVTTPGTAQLSVFFRRPNLPLTATPIIRNIPIVVFDKNANGTFEQGTDICYTDQSFYTDAACQALGGTTDLLDSSRCKSLNIYQRTGTTDPAITLNGDLLVNANAPDTGKITAADTIQAGGNMILNSGSGLLRLGANSGTLSIAAGTTAAQGANLSLTNAGGATLNANTITMNSQLGTPGTALTVNGSAAVNGSTVITSATNALTVNGPTTVLGATNITGTTGINGVTTITGATIGLNGTVNVTGATNHLSGDVTINNGFAILNKTYADLGDPGTGNPKWLVNKEWVWNALTGNLANQLSAAQKDAIVQYVLAQSANTGWLALKTGILGYIQKSGSACGAGTYVSDINYTNNSGTTPSYISFTCTALSGINCGTSGVCATVYATNLFCTTYNGLCQSNVKYDVWGACDYASAFGWGNTANIANGTNTWFCPTNYFMAGLRGAEPFCCPSANR